MKTRIHTLQDALAYQLNGLYCAEQKVNDEFGRCYDLIPSDKVKMEMRRYIESSGDKILKLERIFNYLMQETRTRKNIAVEKLLEEADLLLNTTDSAHLRDILMVGCMQTLNAYKIAAYRTAYLFAVELELDTASDLLQQILEWEIQTSGALSSLAVMAFNMASAPSKV